MRVTAIFLSALLGAGLIVGGTAWGATDPSGVWIDGNGRGAVEIKDCGANLCGHIVWARDEADSSKGCGKQIIGDVQPQGNGLWDNGWIYDPDTGKRYDVELKLLDDNRLLVKGYAGVKFFSRSMIWKRAPVDIKRCDATAANANVPVRPGNPANTELTGGANAPASSEASKSTDNNIVAAAPSVARSPEVKSDESTDAPSPNETAPTARLNRPKVAAADDPRDSEARPKVGPLLEKLRDLRFGSGYGVTATGDGNCRLKVPHFSMIFKCEE
jgi:uncharacterized protein (DUF2147 family)